ncbi:hypothetical protein BJV78DRAFT_1264281 [Lactifluus subvellereus]|nr:hypothetical protein BJV78DRAFT_1264281 [Lactifluus subvellereus]
MSAPGKSALVLGGSGQVGRHVLHDSEVLGLSAFYACVLGRATPHGALGLSWACARKARPTEGRF